jgi:D-serine deaminase-like pyridoxal phosphate-dependent protein
MLEGSGRLRITKACQYLRLTFDLQARSNTRHAVGDVVRIVPNHVCVVVNMVDEVVMVRGDAILGTLPVAARGKLK